MKAIGTMWGTRKKRLVSQVTQEPLTAFGTYNGIGTPNLLSRHGELSYRRKLRLLGQYAQQ